MGSRKGGGIFTPVKTPQEGVLDTISILHKGAKTEDMGEESALEAAYGHVQLQFRGFMWSPVVVETHAGRKGKFLPGARTGAWVSVCCLVRPLVAM